MAGIGREVDPRVEGLNHDVALAHQLLQRVEVSCGRIGGLRDGDNGHAQGIAQEVGRHIHGEGARATQNHGGGVLPYKRRGFAFADDVVQGGPQLVDRPHTRDMKQEEKASEQGDLAQKPCHQN